ncbi:MAG: DUF4433 domain-containing protein [Chloroflexi bacterium]|nr:DUF4433 domain-containing protein [Chloroflexota bacterium]
MSSILRSGRLLCRSEAASRGELLVSSGSQVELSRTAASVKQRVRLYFRPKTPTQYHAEGIKSAFALQRSRYPDAHCPVPVFLLFDAADVLTRSGTMFSDGGLNTTDPIFYSTAAELAAMPWRLIYHVGSFDSARDRSILHHRQAEVVIPHELDLEALKLIVCRSEAEKDTLLHLMGPNLSRQYHKRVVATGRLSLHERTHTFVDKAVLSSDAAVFRFSPDTKSPGPFDARFIIEGQNTVHETSHRILANRSLRVTFQPLSSYSITLLLDGHLAYAGSFVDTELVF